MECRHLLRDGAAEGLGEVVVKTLFSVEFPIPANEFVTKARLELRADRMSLLSLSERRVAPLQSEEDIEILVTLHGRTLPVQVSKDGRVIRVALVADFEPSDTEEGQYALPRGLVATASNYVNRLLDIARLVTDDPAIERVGRGSQQVVVVLRPPQHGMDAQLAIVLSEPGRPSRVEQRIDTRIGSDEILELPVAERRLSQEDVERIRELCADEGALPVWDYLLSSARYSFHLGACREALLNSHTAIEARVDKLIYASLRERGVQQKRAEGFLSEASFKYKVTVCLPALCGVVMDAELLERVLNLHGRRNAVAHLGAQVFQREASGALSTARRALAALDRGE